MYLADDYFRKSGVRDRANVIYASAGKAIFGVKKYANPLNQVVARKAIETRYPSAPAFSYQAAAWAGSGSQWTPATR